jgi:hypothetical protein
MPVAQGKTGLSTAGVGFGPGVAVSRMMAARTGDEARPEASANLATSLSMMLISFIFEQ